MRPLAGALKNGLGRSRCPPLSDRRGPGRIRDRSVCRCEAGLPVAGLWAAAPALSGGRHPTGVFVAPCN
jgi:hypothetical protein